MTTRKWILLLALAALVLPTGCGSGKSSPDANPGGTAPPGYQSPKKKTAL